MTETASIYHSLSAVTETVSCVFNSWRPAGNTEVPQLEATDWTALPRPGKGVRAFLWSEAGKESSHWDSVLQYYVGLNNLSHQKWADYQARGAEI